MLAEPCSLTVPESQVEKDIQYPFCEILSGCGVLSNSQSAPED